jgi:hypothetical protein
MFKQKEEEVDSKVQKRGNKLVAKHFRRSYKFLLEVGVAESSVNASRISSLNLTLLFALFV